MNLSFSLILALGVLLSAGFVAGLWFGRMLNRARADGELAQAQAESAAKLAVAEARAAQAQTLERELVQLRDDQSQLRALLASAETELKAERQQSVEKIELLGKAREALSNEFKALAAQVLDEKSKTFSEQSEKDLTNLLGPLKTKLEEFKLQVDNGRLQDVRDRTALAEQVNQLAKLNQALSDDAKNLTKALVGDSKTQGNWGELVLETILEASGLREGHEFFVQRGKNNDEGANRRPDVVVQLPGNRQLVIDSKVSLTAYEALVSEEDTSQQKKRLDEHLNSIKRHIGGLSDKKYHLLYEGVQSLDFVLMFVPLEPAFMTAISNDKGLFMSAWEKNVLLVSPSTLLFVVRTVAHLWRQESQNRNAQEIAKRGAELYDKLALFADSMEDLGDRLRQAQDSYNEATSRLSTGKGNLIRQAEMLKDLGVKPTKQISRKFADADEGAAEALPRLPQVRDLLSDDDARTGT
jgi:DNA recombination protein RmuC